MNLAFIFTNIFFYYFSFGWSWSSCGSTVRRFAVRSWFFCVPPLKLNIRGVGAGSSELQLHPLHLCAAICLFFLLSHAADFHSPHPQTRRHQHFSFSFLSLWRLVSGPRWFRERRWSPLGEPGWGWPMYRPWSVSLCLLNTPVFCAGTPGRRALLRRRSRRRRRPFDSAQTKSRYALFVTSPAFRDPQQKGEFTGLLWYYYWKLFISVSVFESFR